MSAIEFGSCQFRHVADDALLMLHSRDLDGVDHTHSFYLADAFLVNIAGSFWRFVTGVGDDSQARYLFEDVGEHVEGRVKALRELGVQVLSKEEGKMNLERHQLPVKRLMIAAS